MNGNNNRHRMPHPDMSGNPSGHPMPAGSMSKTGDAPDRAPGGMQQADSRRRAGQGAMGSGVERVLVELRIARSEEQLERGPLSARQAADLTGTSFRIDRDYAPVPVALPSGPEGQTAQARSPDERTVIVRGTVESARLAELEAQPNVVKVWADTPIAPFGKMLFERDVALKRTPAKAPVQAPAACPIEACDCSPEIPKGTLAEVAAYLGADRLWDAGFRGEGMVIGVVDGGITAEERSTSSGDTLHPGWPDKLVPGVIDGWPSQDWGTTGVDWEWHGNMCSTDVLGIAPNARIYDIRISGDQGAISNALAGFQWAIDRHRADGTPHVLSNSWGIFQEEWDRAYARDPQHPFTRKVLEAIDEGILVLFAAGNCGGTCPSDRCGSDIGPGRSIWGANSLQRVMTVGAVNKNEQFVGYSSQGPGALDADKPDFCSITHFTGYFPSDTGTSAATPVAAGVVALLKQAKPDATQEQIKQALKNTAKDIGPTGFDPHAGAGIIRAKSAFDSLLHIPPARGPIVTRGVNRLDIFVVGTDSALYHQWWDGEKWQPSATGYDPMGGTLLSSPEVVAWAPNRLDVFAVGTDSALYHKWWDGTAWGPSATDWHSLGGTILGQPKVVSWAPNRLDIFAVGTDSALYHKWWDGTAWGPSATDWHYLGGTILGNPEVVSWGTGRLDIFVVGTDSALYHKWWDGANWGPSATDWHSLGGTILGQPKAVAWAPDRLDIFVVGADSALYHKWWDGANWGPSVNGYDYMGGTLLGSPEAVAWAPERLDIFGIGTDSALYHKWWDGANWGPSATDWQYLGGTILGQPKAVAWAPDRLDIFAVGTDSALYHKWWDGANWGPSLTGYDHRGGSIIRF